MTLNQTLVESAFNESAPNIPTITEPNKTYITTIKTPYIMAFLIPAARFLLCFVKKLTVKGIIGNTQGVNKAANPDKNAIKNIPHNPFDSELLEPSSFLASST